MTSSVKPEVHNVSQCCHRRTDTWPLATCTKIRWSSATQFLCYASGQTDRLTNRQTSYNTSQS